MDDVLIRDPSFVDMAPSKRKRKRKANRTHQNWEPDVPRCQNCVNWSGRARKGFVIVPYCGIGGFSTTEMGVCDLWAGKDGAVLEREENPT